MIDLAQLRREPDAVADALARRGVDRAEVDALVEADAEHRRALQGAEETRARVKALSREVADARRAGDAARADALTGESRALGEDERAARAAAGAWRSGCASGCS